MCELLGGARERSGEGEWTIGRAGRAECAGRVRALEVSGCAWTCLWACQSVGGFGVRMDMSMGVLGHSELVGARDGYRKMKLFGQNKSKDDTRGAPCKVLSINNIAIFRVDKTTTLKMA